MTDSLHKFMLAGGLVRGAAVRLSSTWQEVQRRRDYPATLHQLLGEMTAGTALMAASIKFNGSLILQMMGEGALRVAVAEAAPGMALRATAKWREPLEAASLAELLGANNPDSAARCVITLDPQDKLPGQQAYQGIVSLSDDDDQPFTTLAEVLANYMGKSEQIQTRFLLACDATSAVGLLVQRMPHQGGTGSAAAQQAESDKHERASQAAFEEACVMLATLKSPELLGTAPQDIIRKLFWEQDLQQWDAAMEEGGSKPHFYCACSRERVGHMLRMLGRGEVESILSERENVEVGCDFCGKQYHFDAVDAAQVFLASEHLAPSTESRQ